MPGRCWSEKEERYGLLPAIPLFLPQTFNCACLMGLWGAKCGGREWPGTCLPLKNGL